LTRNALTRYRRPSNPEPTLRLIAFQLRHHHFCLPLATARRVVFCSATSLATKAGLLKFNQDNIPLVDIADWIYQAMPLLPGQVPPALMVYPHTDQVVLIIETPRLGRLGLLVDGTPSLKRAKASAFSPVPATYLKMNHLQGITTLVTLSDDEPLLFLLEIDALWPSMPSLTPSEVPAHEANR
jgi:chemotaxis signal transduction protein